MKQWNEKRENLEKTRKPAKEGFLLFNCIQLWFRARYTFHHEFKAGKDFGRWYPEGIWFLFCRGLVMSCVRAFVKIVTCQASKLRRWEGEEVTVRTAWCFLPRHYCDGKHLLPFSLTTRFSTLLLRRWNNWIIISVNCTCWCQRK